MAFYVYILKCADGAYYTGHTDNPEVRLAAHRQAQADTWVSKRLPVELVFIESAPTREEALAFEQQIKRWSRVKKRGADSERLGSIQIVGKKLLRATSSWFDKLTTNGMTVSAALFSLSMKRQLHRG